MNFWIQWIIKSPVVYPPGGSCPVSGPTTIYDLTPVIALVLIASVFVLALVIYKKYGVRVTSYMEHRERPPIDISQIKRIDTLTQSSRSAESSGRLDEATPMTKEKLLEHVDGQREILKELEPEIRVKVEKDLNSREEEQIMESLNDIDNQQHTYDEADRGVGLKKRTESASIASREDIPSSPADKKDLRKTPEARARFLENMRKARDKKKLEKEHGKTKGVRPKGAG